MPKSASVLIATPREIVNAGLKDVLEDHATVIGEATSDAKAVAMAKKLAPTVALVSDQFRGSDAIDTAVKILAATQVRVVMIGVEQNPIYAARAAAAGVSDYVLEGSSPKVIVVAVLGAASGAPSKTREAFFPKLKAELDEQKVIPGSSLTPREQQVLRHIAYGLSNNEIAKALVISVETVKEHVQNVLRKTSMRDRTHAAVWAMKSGNVL
jgi:DNA-binding NarL/FixJ family response regulator